MLNADTLTKWMTNFETRITKEKDHLTELDRVIGDSDHGNNMERGVEAIKAAFEKPHRLPIWLKTSRQLQWPC